MCHCAPLEDPHEHDVILFNTGVVVLLLSALAGAALVLLRSWKPGDLRSAALPVSDRQIDYLGAGVFGGCSGSMRGSRRGLG
jgi:hypothetical protein